LQYHNHGMKATANLRAWNLEQILHSGCIQLSPGLLERKSLCQQIWLQLHQIAIRATAPSSPWMSLIPALYATYPRACSLSCYSVVAFEKSHLEQLFPLRRCEGFVASFDEGRHKANCSRLRSTSFSYSRNISGECVCQTVTVSQREAASVRF
jgi:hypothetical protein